MITAKEAREIAINQKSMTIEAILFIIEEAASKGRIKVEINHEIKDSVVDELKGLGYRIYGSPANYTIDWEY